MADLGELCFQAALCVDVDGQGHILALLPDHSLEQTLLSAEPGVQRRLRSADNADDVVERDVVVAFLEEQRPDGANDAFAALLDRLRAAGTARVAALRSAGRPTGALYRHALQPS